MNRKFLYNFYEKIERLVTPKLKYSQSIYEDVLTETLPAGASWLDLGCGHNILPSWRDKAERDLVQKAGFIVGLDAYLPSLGKHQSIQSLVCGDVSSLPFQAGVFDLVTANMVVEHLAKPEVQFNEVRRVLKPGGVFVFHTVNARGYKTVFARMIPEVLKGRLVQILEGRPSEDVFKTHYRANTESQISRVAQETRLEVVDIRFIASTAEFAMIAPLAFFELLWIKLLMTHPFRRLRPNLIVTLARPSQNGPHA